MTKTLLRALFVVLLPCVLLWIFSPYQRSKDGKTQASVNIDAPCATVFEYLGDSNHAKDWSVFVAFIKPLNADLVLDGKVGSKRMCYTQEDEEGLIWEEEVLERKENAYRKLSCYNFQNVGIAIPDLLTEQIYETQGGDEDACSLTFTLYFKEKPTWWNVVKMKCFGYYVKYIFEENLQNIGKEVMQQQILVNDTVALFH